MKVKSLLGRLRRWTVVVAAPVLAPVFAHAALAWAVAKLIGAATVRSRVAALLAAFCGARLVGFVAGPIGAAVLLGLPSGSVTATALWAAPTIRLFVALRDGSPQRDSARTDNSPARAARLAAGRPSFPLAIGPSRMTSVWRCPHGAWVVGRFVAGPPPLHAHTRVPRRVFPPTRAGGC